MSLVTNTVDSFIVLDELLVCVFPHEIAVITNNKIVFLKLFINSISVNFEYFIAKRIIDKKSYKSSISAPIIKIGIVAIALGVIVMLIAIATGIGLQQKIRDKVVAFNGHATISKYDTNNSKDSDNTYHNKQDFYPEFKSVPEVTHIQAVATKSGIIRIEDDFEVCRCKRCWRRLRLAIF